MNPRLLANENFPGPALHHLRAAGLDVESILEIMPAASDRRVLEYAREQDRWLITFDRDYGELVFRRLSPPPPAIVYLRQGRYPADEPARIVLGVLAQAAFATGHLVVVSGRSIRRREFPRSA